MSLGAELGDRIACIKRSSTSAGTAGLGYPAPTRHDDKVQVRVTRSILGGKEVPYLPHQQMTGLRLH